MATKRILYVDRERNSDLLEILRRTVAVDIDVPLTTHSVEWVRKDVENGNPHDAVISHMPFDPDVYPAQDRDLEGRRAQYKEACDHLINIRRITDVPMIIYTGACSNDIPSDLRNAGDVSVLHKTRNIQEDAHVLLTLLRCAWQKQGRLQSSIPPEIHKGSEEIWVDVDVKHNAFSQLSLFVYFYKLLVAFDSIQLESLSDDPPPPHVMPQERGSILDLLVFIDKAGNRLRVKTTDKGSKAVNHLRVIHLFFQVREHEMNC